MSVWERSAFCATPGNVPVAAQIPPHIRRLFKPFDLRSVPDSIERLFVPVAWGTTATPPAGDWLAKARERFDVYAWAWCDGKDVEGEARVHAQAAQGYAAFSANMEEPYDAHGDSSSPRYGMPARYLDALDLDVPLAVTTTGTFGSDMTAWIQRGALCQPQAFYLENGVGLTQGVEHAQAWGWPLAQIRPLVQSYPTDGERPDPEELNAEAWSLGVGGIPYTIEQCLDSEGQAWLVTMEPTISREQASSIVPPMPEPAPDVDPPLLPFAGPHYPPSDPQGRGPTKGQDVIAIKRAVSRAGYFPWQSFDDTYNESIGSAVASFQRDNGISATGNYGGATHGMLSEEIAAPPHADEYAFDAKAVDLYRKAGAPVLPFNRALYGPDDPQGRGGENGTTGKDVEAVKRALSRAGFMEWGDFTRTYGEHAVAAVQAFQRTVGIDATGNYGSKTHDALRITPRNSNEWAFDAYGIDLYEQATEAPPPSGGRDAALAHLKKRVGYVEQPDGSNCDSRSDGIRTAQDHTAGGGTWLRYQPWCGCWCYYALEAAGVANIDSHLASVASIEDHARAGQKCYRGWTTERSKVEPGDLVVVGGYGVHVETVRGQPNADGSVPTYGGNTSPGSGGSQSNGGGAYQRTRYPSEIRGFALVRYPGE